MKTEFKCVVIFIFFSVSLHAQQESRFPVKSGSVWRINYEYCCGWDSWAHVEGDEEYKYFIDGDTSIGNKTYFKLHKTGILFLDTPFSIKHKYIGAIRDSANKYFYIDEGQSNEILLYDFDAKIGETMQTDGFPVDDIDTLDSGRKMYIFYIINVHCGSANTIIEGIGWLGGLLEGNSCSMHPGVRGSYLVCYSEDGEIIYQTDHTRGDQPVLCNLDISSVKGNKNDSFLEVLVLPDKQLEIKVPEGITGSYDITIYSITGLLIYQQRACLTEPIDLNKLNNGVYLVSLNNGKQFFTAKFLIY